MSVRKVTIEGSLTPSVVLPRGERRTVALTDRVQRLIDRGFVILIEDESDAPEPAEVDERTDAEREADEQAALARSLVPKGNASRDEWADYLSQHADVEFTDDDGRDDLVRKYQARLQEQA